MKKEYLFAAILITAAIFFVLFFSTIGDIRRFHRSDVAYHGPVSMRSWYGLRARHMSLADLNYIREWMSYDYINKSFNLPPAYLKSELNIPETAYPNVLISKTAKDKQTAAAAYLTTVKEAVRKYLSPTQTPR